MTARRTRSSELVTRTALNRAERRRSGAEGGRAAPQWPLWSPAESPRRRRGRRTRLQRSSGRTGASATSAPARRRSLLRSSSGTSSTTGTTGSCTRAATCGPCTSCTIRASATTCRRRCDSRSPTLSEPSSLRACSALRDSNPSLISSARGINLIYQFWIHTEAIGRLGALEKVLNTPSHHRVHHGVNPQYIDRNHGSILIIWDRLFGTFEPEGERVVYGLTRNIKTFNPLRIAAHEHREMLSDVWHSRGWRERLSYVVRGPGGPTATASSRHPSTAAAA